MLIELCDGTPVKLLPMTLAKRERFLVVYNDFIAEFAYCLSLLPEASVHDICFLHAKFADLLGQLREFLPKANYSMLDLEVLFLPSEYSRIGLWLEVNAISASAIREVCAQYIESKLKTSMDSLELEVYLALEKAMKATTETYDTTKQRSGYSHKCDWHETDFIGLELDNDAIAEPTVIVSSSTDSADSARPGSSKAECATTSATTE